MKIYEVVDLASGDEFFFTTKEFARQFLLDHLKNDCGYSSEEWEQMASGYGFVSAAHFQDTILSSDEWDFDLSMAVYEIDIIK